MPDFKIIADFPKDNSKAIRGVCRQFVSLCQQLGLFGENCRNRWVTRRPIGIAPAYSGGAGHPRGSKVSTEAKRHE